MRKSCGCTEKIHAVVDAAAGSIERGGKGVSRQQKTSAYAIMSIVAGADAGCLSSAAR